MTKDTKKNQHDDESEEVGQEQNGDALVPDLSSFTPEKLKEIQEISMGMFMSGPMASPYHKLIEKFTPEHVSQFLDNERQEDDNRYKLEGLKQKYNLVYAILGILLLVFLVVFLAKDNQELLGDIIKISGGIVGGTGLGVTIGYKVFHEKK